MPPKRQAPQLSPSDHDQKESELLHNVVAMVGDLKQELGGLKQELRHQRETAEVAVHKQHEEITSLHRLVRDAIEETNESNFIYMIPEFHGLMEDDEVLDWLDTAKHLMDCASVPADRRVKLAFLRFRAEAANWYRRTYEWKRERAGEPVISTWEELENEMKSYFLPCNYQSTMWRKMWELKQGSLTVYEYTNLFYEFLWKTDRKEGIDQTMGRYVAGLEWNIQCNLCPHNFKSLDELVNGAKAIEASLNCPSRNRRSQ